MGAPKEKRPQTFAEYVSVIEECQANVPYSLWYRGCGKATHALVPGLYRHKQKKAIADLAKLETQLMGRFRQLSVPFHDRSLLDDWEALFFMQHYRVPTRLLDWSENPFVAFYFAVMSAECKFNSKGEASFRHDAAIWILDPVAWNKHALQHQSFDGGVLAAKDEELKGYQSTASYKSMNKLPVALYGTHNSPRIVAQRGVFAIFGQDLRPMEQAYDAEAFPADSLVKIVLEKGVMPKFRKAILSYGITESVIFPDLDGLASEIRRTFGFES